MLPKWFTNHLEPLRNNGGTVLSHTVKLRDVRHCALLHLGHKSQHSGFTFIWIKMCFFTTLKKHMRKSCMFSSSISNKAQKKNETRDRESVISEERLECKNWRICGYDCKLTIFSVCGSKAMVTCHTHIYLELWAVQIISRFQNGYLVFQKKKKLRNARKIGVEK